MSKSKQPAVDDLPDLAHAWRGEAQMGGNVIGAAPAAVLVRIRGGL